MDPREDNGSNASAEVSDPVVRPFGYVETEAVVRRIGDRDLYLGNKFAAIPGEHPEEFDFVISATDEAFPRTTHHRPLIDGSGNEWADFEAAVDTARTLFDAEGRLLIHCTAGISRSSTLVATAIAAEEERRFREALRIVQEARPFAMPNPALHELAVVYLAANG
ncbi:phosphatase [Halobiforma lacisalsi AJ5]|uniref:Phosphatase n=1 Tax=Natronobacterium lacisalsi AJ5 TaxID=358396 RepID=M0LY09_NATLA|nr:dual specificity protein phosphatase family protein [Halobiforma lacisalsi]APW97633.1 phosphatase [Halobiforma lacisalsi AJ5]EMA36980.1 Dual specificity protein phosphatase [Halobiforma lacisalsi AJ5]